MRSGVYICHFQVYGNVRFNSVCVCAYCLFGKARMKKCMFVFFIQFFLFFYFCFQKGVSFGNVEFLYVDLVVTSLLTVVIGRTGPAKKLVKTRPIARLISFGNLFPLALQVLILFLVQMLAVEFLSTQPWLVFYINLT